MIRRLFLYQPMTEDEARAASAWAEKLGDERLTIAYRPARSPMRVLMFDAETKRGHNGTLSRGFVRVRRLDGPEDAANAALADAMASGDVVFNVYTGREDDRSAAWSSTDAVFTVAFPDGAAVAWFARVAGAAAPGIAYQCLASWTRRAGSPFFIVRQFEASDLGNSVRFLFFKRRPKNIREHEERVMCYAMDRLDEVNVGSGFARQPPSLLL